MSTSVRVEDCVLAAATLTEDPLPVVADAATPPTRASADVAADVVERMQIPAVRNLFPYTIQNQYDRELQPQTFTSIVLENEHLRARVLPELGGRIWSLHDLDRDVGLLHENSAVQFANLALRDAWFAGGIEWNIGTRGHSPSTASPLHTALVPTADGTVLRMWEYERLRGVVFSIDLWLPAGSPVLHAAVTVTNPNPEPVPMYWWTNAAVPQTDRTRVLTPSRSSITTEYGEGVGVAELTEDMLWPARAPHAVDHFFDPVPGERPWTASIDDAGDGLVLLSTARLQGRKLFCWGEGSGGHRWQRWLTPDGRHYAEIQSGLARTQFEHLMMDPGQSWTWVEAYGNVRATDVDRARDRIEQLWPADRMDQVLADARTRHATPPEALIVTGSGWGALEERRRQLAGEPPLAGPGTPFTTTDERVRPWLTLLSDAELPDADPTEADGSQVRGTHWEQLLTTAPSTWSTLAQRAVMAHARGDLTAAAECSEQSLAQRLNLLALRSRALVRLERGATEEAIADLFAAVGLAGPRSIRSIVIEAARELLAHGRPEAALHVIEIAPEPVRGLGRVQFLRAAALHALGRDTEAGELLRTGIEIPDLREGDDRLSDLWTAVFGEEPLPQHYDFRMMAVST